MANRQRGDVLLTISRIGLHIYIAVTALFAVIVAGATIVILLDPKSNIFEGLASAPSFALPLIVVGAMVVLLTLFLSVLFAMQLGRIIGTVRTGDPFEPANAERLARMGWYALGATAGGWLASGIAFWLSQYFEELTVNFGAPCGGIVLAATVFILARVFRHGSAMRDDLIGTV
ncbi:DUF2975 domain-containing protein [Sphingomonas psychrotolerans]|uniref:DUF2975 domain-containing protein n=1 Tax=Sphingomonas psychrotolerans TaxID=1327635 RepID=A0A2K8MNL6_9SPHN|nr:DUF2975 domain-containing protein [Sphingomonas psychrotolerans]ATY33569.1 hypothetical protein CVN68_17700 [Sphingomonas psychrotolerans]